MNLQLREIKFRYCRRICDNYHYLGSPIGHKFSLGIYFENRLIGVMIFSHPTSRKLMNKNMLEMTRCCFMEKIKNAGSISLSKAIKYIKKNYPEIQKVISYSDEFHNGIMYKASGWEKIELKNSKANWKSGKKLRRNVRWEKNIQR